ncbi:GtrA family protein [Lapidilactobacillus mulanensis]|uniref:GtrA family protein n=1 Tax=Lapidilactobacillus mulanensis TaxID=2485999 RepID=A0ABW4DQE0_9LACO|nr:GtrA family protein [Lapidilactobacillus mulanensis]
MKLYQKFRAYLEKHGWWSIFMYLFYGGWTTVVNIVAFAICHNLLSFNWQIANTIAWILSVLFAFVTNKLWVFHSKTETFGALSWEFAKFVFARLISYGMDMGSMYILIDLMSANTLLAKLITQVIIVIANYFFSKIFIFKSREK